MSDETTTFVSMSTEDRPARSSWYLVLAFTCADPRGMPRRLALHGATTVEIGRGDATGWRRLEGGKLIELTLADRGASQQHARIFREGTGWRVEDLGSKNGTRRNGEILDKAQLVDGDVIECGGTFLVAREAPRGAEVSDLELPVGPHPLLRTLAAGFHHDIELLARVARTGVAVLLAGESGTGKEVAASATHEISGRSGPFLAVNCGALAPSLVASELFGVKRGAYSGADQDRVGLVRAAHGGTLFLDEIGELGLESQAALLRVLQEHEVTPVGGTKAVKVDLRVIAATNKPIEELASAGLFRRDLLARLRGFELRLPPLRARIEDLGYLIGTLLERIEPGRGARSFNRSAARALFRHSWPMHVRELEQALRSATAVADGDELGLDDLPESVRGTRAPAVSEEPSAASDPVTRERFAALVTRHAGNISTLARALATSRSQVRRLATRWGIDLAGARAR